MRKSFKKLLIRIFKNHKKKNKIMMDKSILSANDGNNSCHINSSAMLTIEKQKDMTYQIRIEKMLNDYIDKPQKLFEYIKGAGTKVFLNKYAAKILSKINEQEGLIYPKKGLKALYLNLIFNKKLSFKTDEMFVLSSYNVNLVTMSYQFYNWYACKMNLNGYEFETQEKFKNVFEVCETDKINDLSFEEIISLKNAIRRDIEAIDFVKKLVVNKSTAKKNLEKIKTGQAISV